MDSNDLKTKLEIIKNQFSGKIARATKLHELQELKTEYLGKNSVISSVLKDVTKLSHESRIIIGQTANVIKNDISQAINAKYTILEKAEIDNNLRMNAIDLTFPGTNFNVGHRNPLLKIADQICEIFKNLGYQIVSGNEIENEKYNFNNLNLPPDHPARGMQDTFYLDIPESKVTGKWLLRTHATNMTARILETNAKNKQQSSAIISIGNVYRKDNDDATHSHQFMQVDGFLVAPNINFTNLKWTLNYFCQQLFGAAAKTRLRPSYFPFTEPSVEVDVSCPMCNLGGCALCKYSGWIEILGAGMLHPNVFNAAGLDSSTTGFAFGMGIERIAMIKYGIDDIRLFYNNDLRFLNQF